MRDQRLGPSLNQVNLIVRHLPASIAFYRQLGIAVEEAARPEWAAHHASAILPNRMRFELDSEPFARQWNPGLRSGRGGYVLFFAVSTREEVDQVHATMSGAGYSTQRSPLDAFWGARYAIAEDPDGNSVGVMSPIDPTRRYPPLWRPSQLLQNAEGREEENR